MQRSITVVVGKKPRPGTIVAEAIEAVEAREVRCRVLLPHEQDVAPTDAVDAGLVVTGGSPAVTTPCCSPWPTPGSRCATPGPG